MPIRAFAYELICAVVLYISCNEGKEYSLFNTDVTAISTEGCTIPGFPLIGCHIHDLVGRPENLPNCSEAVPLLGSNATHIWTIKESYDHHNIWIESDFYCCYHNFTAFGNLENIAYGECIQFQSSIEAAHEYVKIECYYSENKVYDDYFIFFSKNKNNAKCVYSDKGFPNVIMLGIESMSRMNFLRTMPKTAQYLRDKGSVQFLGYNKLGDNSFPNLFPMLTGKLYQNVRESCLKNNVFHTDVCPFIWDRFKNNGYVTALGADSSAGFLGSYEFTLPKAPTDYYLQPFMYETRNVYKHRDYDYHICLRNKLMYKQLLNYVKNVSRKTRTGKLFGIFWEETITHEHLNYPHIMDEDYVDLLKKWDQAKYLQKTVVILFSDHGMRFGDIVQTNQGRLESRLPLLEILLPDDIRRQHSKAYENLKTNARRLTTPLDVYATLLDLNNLTSIEDKNINDRSESLNVSSSKLSLFLPIPAKRTCESVGINDHWCTCQAGTRIYTKYQTRRLAARYIIAHINALLKNYTQCHQLEIEQIFDVIGFKSFDQVQTYTVVLKARPGGAIFDGTLLRDHNNWVVTGTISRLNMYRGQDQCIQDNLLKMYCFCK